MAEDNGAQTMANEAKKLVMESMQESQTQARQAQEQLNRAAKDLTKKPREKMMEKIKERLNKPLDKALTRLSKGKGPIARFANGQISKRTGTLLTAPKVWKSSPMEPVMTNNEQKRAMIGALKKVLENNPQLRDQLREEYAKMMQGMRGELSPWKMMQQNGHGQGFFQQATKTISKAAENITHKATKTAIKTATKATETAITAATTALSAIPGVGAVAKAGGEAAKAGVRAAGKTAEKVEDARHNVTEKIQGQGQGQDMLAGAQKIANITDKIGQFSKQGAGDNFAMTAINMAQEATKNQNR